MRIFERISFKESIQRCPVGRHQLFYFFFRHDCWHVKDVEAPPPPPPLAKKKLADLDHHLCGLGRQLFVARTNLVSIVGGGLS